MSLAKTVNPFSKYSGITYFAPAHKSCHGHEMMDLLVTEQINRAFRRDRDIIKALQDTYTILIGCHYDRKLTGRYNKYGGAKGFLDFLIVPLAVRTLVAHAFMTENADNYGLKFLAAIIGLPFEITRTVVGIALTCLLSPLVWLIHTIKSIPQKNNLNQEIVSNNQKRINALNLSKAELQELEKYCCPVSLQVMDNPISVIAHPMQRFDEAAIENWLLNNNTNPLSPSEILSFDETSQDGLYLDYDFKNEIETYITELENKALKQNTTVSV